MDSNKYFETIVAGIMGDYQVIFERGIHVDAFKAVVWNIARETEKTELLDRSLLDLCDRVIESLYKLVDDKTDMLWLS